MYGEFTTGMIKELQSLSWVVKRTENAADSLTGERLELGEDHLCEGIEMNDDKKCNKYLMTTLCEQACKIHAK